MSEKNWTMKCYCNAPNCRGEIKDFDTLPSELQRYYLDLGIVQNFIVQEFVSRYK